MRVDRDPDEFAVGLCCGPDRGRPRISLLHAHPRRVPARFGSRRAGIVGKRGKENL